MDTGILKDLIELLWVMFLISPCCVVVFFVLVVVLIFVAINNSKKKKEELGKRENLAILNRLVADRNLQGIFDLYTTQPTVWEDCRNAVKEILKAVNDHETAEKLLGTMNIQKLGNSLFEEMLLNPYFDQPIKNEISIYMKEFTSGTRKVDYRYYESATNFARLGLLSDTQRKALDKYEKRVRPVDPDPYRYGAGMEEYQKRLDLEAEEKRRWDNIEV